MAFERLIDNLNRVIQKVEDYGTSTAEYYKLRLFRSAMKFSTALVNMLVLGFISFLFLIFISIGLALYLSSVIGNPFAGFLIVGSLYLVILLLTLFLGKAFIEKKMLLKFSDLLIDDDKYDPEEVAEENMKTELYEEELAKDPLVPPFNENSRSYE